MQSWRQYGVRFGDPKFDIICTKYMRVNLPSLSRPVFFSLILLIIRGHLLVLLSDKVVVLPTRITFKRIDSAILKPILSCLKSIVVWNICAIKTAY